MCRLLLYNEAGKVKSKRKKEGFDNDDDFFAAMDRIKKKKLRELKKMATKKKETEEIKDIEQNQSDKKTVKKTAKSKRPTPM